MPVEIGKQNQIRFTFPNTHKDAAATITLQRTLRIPDDGKTYPLPPGLGAFPLVGLGDISKDRLPARFIENETHALMPMWQAEAMWLSFGGFGRDYPVALIIAAGGINAASGEALSNTLSNEPLNYLDNSVNPWLDGFKTDKGTIKQFVAMPLGLGVTVEEQLTKQANGGLQLIAIPLKAEVYEEWLKNQPKRNTRGMALASFSLESAPDGGMGLGAGGAMAQELYQSKFKLEDWDYAAQQSFNIGILNSWMWQAVVGQAPPSIPPTAKDYTNSGYPWFSYYDDSATATAGSKILAGVKTVAEIEKETGKKLLPENQSIPLYGERVIPLRPGQTGSLVILPPSPLSAKRANDKGPTNG